MGAASSRSSSGSRAVPPDDRRRRANRAVLRPPGLAPTRGAIERCSRRASRRGRRRDDRLRRRDDRRAARGAAPRGGPGRRGDGATAVGACSVEAVDPTSGIPTWPQRRRAARGRLAPAPRRNRARAESPSSTTRPDGGPGMTKSLDQKLAHIHADPGRREDFILADAKDADMASGWPRRARPSTGAAALARGLPRPDARDRRARGSSTSC